MKTLLAWLTALAILVPAVAAWADAEPPPELGKVDVVEMPGRPIPLELPFVDSGGNPERFGEAFSHARPVVLTLVYFNCPMLCSSVLQGMVQGLSSVDIVPGRDVDLVTVSFDPRDGPQEAAEKRRHYLQSFGLTDAGNEWSFLTGTEPNIRALAEAVGFRYARIAHTSEFAHAAVLFVLTPEGAISRTLYGVEFPKRDLRLAISEASAGRWGSSFDRFLLHCYRYDPATRRYQFYLNTYFRIGGVVLLLAIGGLVGALSLRQLRKERSA